MSSEEKAANQNPDDDQSDSNVEPVEAELADSPPLADPAVDLGPEGSQGPDDSEVVVAERADGAEGDKTGITRFFEDRDAKPGSSVVMATAVGKMAVKPHLVATPPPLATNLQNLSANGGAVGALVLGIWCFMGSFITNWSIINGILGLLLGTWGLTSQRKKTAWIGIALCTIGILLCLAEFSELVNKWMYEVDDTIVEQ